METSYAEGEASTHLVFEGVVRRESKAPARVYKTAIAGGVAA